MATGNGTYFNAPSPSALVQTATRLDLSAFGQTPTFSALGRHARVCLVP